SAFFCLHRPRLTSVTNSQSNGSSQALVNSDILKPARLLHVCLDSLQGPHTFAFKIAFACSSQNGFGRKTILNPQGVFHYAFQPFLLLFCHGCIIVESVTNCK